MLDYQTIRSFVLHAASVVVVGVRGENHDVVALVVIVVACSSDLMVMMLLLALPDSTHVIIVGFSCLQ